MTKEKYLEIKQELKNLAKKIKKTKPIFRRAQRDFSLFQNVNGTYAQLMNSGKWSRIRDEYRELEDAPSETNLKHYQFVYRHKHIAYCLLRGRTRDEIERPSNSNSNMPSEYEIMMILKKWGVSTKQTNGRNIIDWAKEEFVPKRARRSVAKEALKV